MISPKTFRFTAYRGTNPEAHAVFRGGPVTFAVILDSSIDLTGCTSLRADIRASVADTDAPLASSIISSPSGTEFEFSFSTAEMNHPNSSLWLVISAYYPEGVGDTDDNLDPLYIAELTVVAHNASLLAPQPPDVSVYPTGVFRDIAVSGQSTITADSYTDTLTFVGGGTIVITTDAATDTVAITSPAVDLTNLNASNLTSGTVPDARFPATLPVISAVNLTNITAANITGDIARARINNALSANGAPVVATTVTATQLLSPTGGSGYVYCSGRFYGFSGNIGIGYQSDEVSAKTFGLVGASVDFTNVRLGSDGANILQIGTDHATAATAQTIKSHDVTTGTGANLIIAGGKGSVAGGSVSIATSVTNGASVDRFKVNADGTAVFGDSADAAAIGGDVILYQYRTPKMHLSANSASDNLFGYYLEVAGGKRGEFTMNPSSGEVRIGATSTGGYFPTFYSNNAEIMRISIGGDVGIGTTAPLTKLHVAGANRATGNPFNTYGNLLISTTDAEAINKGGLLSFGGNFSGTIYTYAQIRGAKETSGAGSALGYLAFETDNNDALVERMRITSGGNVGIGTTNPLEPLHILSGINSDIYLGSNTANAGEHQIGFGFHTANSHAVTIVGKATGASGRGILEFRVAGGGDATNAVTADTVLRLKVNEIEVLQPITYIQDTFAIGNNYNSGTKAFKFTRTENKAAIWSVPYGSYGNGDIRFTTSNGIVSTAKAASDATIRIAGGGGLIVGNGYLAQEPTDGYLLVSGGISIGSTTNPGAGNLSVTGTGTFSGTNVGVIINRTGDNPYIQLQSSGVQQSSIYGRAGGGVTFHNASNAEKASIDNNGNLTAAAGTFNGPLTFATHNTYDIGDAAGLAQPRVLYVAGSARIINPGGYVQVPGDGLFYFNGQGRITSPADGVILLQNNAQTAGAGLDVTTDNTLAVRNRANNAAGNLTAAAGTFSGVVSCAGVVATSGITGTTGNGFIFPNLGRIYQPSTDGTFTFVNGALSSGFTLNAATTDDTLVVRNRANSAAGNLTAGAATFSGAALFSDGTAAAPSIGWTSDADGSGAGFYRHEANGISTTHNGTSGWQFDANRILGLSTGALIKFSDVTLARNGAAASLRLGAANSATPLANTLTIGESSRSGTDSNVAGANGTIASGTGTGTGAVSNLIFQTPTVAGAGTGAQSLATRLTLNATGANVVGSVSASNGFSVANTSFFYWASRAVFSSPADSKVKLSNNGVTTGVTLDASTDGTLKVRNFADGADGNLTAAAGTFSGDISVSKTITAAGTTGAQTINKTSGRVNFAAAATSLVVTNSLVTANSIIMLTKATNDSTARLGAAVAGAGSFTIHMDVAPAAECAVNFIVIN